MAIVHHTAGASTDYSVQRAYAISRRHPEQPLRPRMGRRSLVTLVAYMCDQYAIPTSAIYGHRDCNATECRVLR